MGSFSLDPPEVVESHQSKGPRAHWKSLLQMPGVPPHRRVLVVDDEPYIRELLAEFLVGRGYQVESVGSGREAIERLGAPGRFDIALVDWHMPGISGRDVIHDIGLRSPSTAVLVTTGGLGERLPRPGSASGWREVLYKPFSLSQLQEAIERALSEVEAEQPGSPDK